MRVRRSEVIRAAAVLVGAVLLACALPAAARAAGGYYPLWSAPHDGITLTDPSDISIGLDGILYVADSSGGRIVALTTSGDFVRAIDGEDAPGQELVNPVAATLGPDGRLYVADAGANRVSVFELDGTFVRSWTGAAAGGALSGPSGIAIASDGTVYVSDTFNDRVKAYSATGQWLRSMGAPGTWGQLAAPGPLLTVDGEVYVTDVANRRIVVFRADGTYARDWGITYGNGNNIPSESRYRAPFGIEAAPGGGVLVADGGSGMLERCSTAGAVLASWTTTPAVDGLAGIAVGADDRVWLADRVASQIVGFRVTDGSLGPTLALAGSSATSELRFPAGAAIAPDGTTYVADSGNGRVQMYSAAGQFQGAFEPAEPLPLVMPVAAAVSPNGLEVAVADTGLDAVVYFSWDGRWMRTIGTGVLADPSAVSIAEDGTIYVADTGNSRVVRFSAMGGLKGVYGTESLVSPAGVAVTASGKVIVADTGSDRIVSFNSTASAPVSVCSPGSAPGFVSDPQGLALEPSGDLLVADTGNRRIQRFTAAGAPLGIIGDPGSGLGEVKTPLGVAANATGRVAIADTGNHRVQVMAFDAEPPTTIVSGVPSEWATGPVTITLSAEDAGIGVASIHYRIGGGVETTYTGPFTVSAQGMTNVWSRSVDRFGNTSNAQPSTVRIDSLPPSGTVSWAEAGSVIATTTVHLTASLPDAEAMRVDLGAGWGPFDAYSESKTLVLPGEGVHHVAAEYSDWLRNARVDSATITVDRTGPQVSFTGIPTSGASSSTVTVRIAASDTPAGVSAIEYSIGGSGFAPYSGPLTFSVTGTHVVRARARDAVGNWSAIAEATVVIDKTPPSGSMLVGDGSHYAHDTAVTIRPAVTGASLMHFEPGFAPGQWSAYEGLVEFDLPGQGIYPIRGSFLDDAGNAFSLVQTLTVDWTPPTSRASGIPEDGPAAGEAYISLVASDTYAGVDRIEYSLDGSATQSYGAPLRITEEGWHTLEWAAVDRSGIRESSTHSAIFAVEGPVLIDSVFAGGLAVVGSRTISVDTSSAMVAQMRFDYGDGPGEWEPFAPRTSLTLPAEGEYQVVAQYRTILGSMASRHGVVLVDTSRPLVPPISCAPGLLHEGESWTYDLNATSNTADQVSGIARHVWRAGSKRLGADTADVTLPGMIEGTVNLVLDVFDFAGNRGQSRTRVTIAGRGVSVAGGSGQPVRVAGAVPFVAGARHTLLCYRATEQPGEWEFRGPADVTTSLSGTNVLIRARPSLPAGRWRFVLRTVSPGVTYIGTPSAEVTVE